MENRQRSPFPDRASSAGSFRRSAWASRLAPETLRRTRPPQPSVHESGIEAAAATASICYSPYVRPCVESNQATKAPCQWFSMKSLRNPRSRRSPQWNVFAQSTYQFRNPNVPHKTPALWRFRIAIHGLFKIEMAPLPTRRQLPWTHPTGSPMCAIW